MFDMTQEILNTIAAIRMIASKDALKAAKFWAENEVSTEIKADLSIEQDEINSLLKTEGHAQIKTARVIQIKGAGYICLANSQAEIEALKENSMFQNNQSTGRVKNRVFVITGGAQGFGAGIAEEIFTEGGNIVIADLNEEKGKEMVKSLNDKNQANKAIFVPSNVSDPKSVENLINQSIMAFGGIDVMISNAGILRAGGLDEMTPDTFRLMTEVNYAGYFNCAKYASKIMKVQTSFKKDYFCDILQINSKSGLQGSKKNFAYAGGKFGGIGLTQSFALELMEYNIKVNSICPGNFFDGPLWADPENGLFVQYLNAGKVPGAKTIEDVKNYYEKQVPAGRGCRVIDVARAIFYAVEQEYETGQAIPVTGGQVMLK
jgi:sorbitol-6-phosphate 2-dehydrogenase